MVLVYEFSCHSDAKNFEMLKMLNARRHDEIDVERSRFSHPSVLATFGILFNLHLGHVLY